MHMDARIMAVHRRSGGIYLRVWLDTLRTDAAVGRAILKLGPTQEVEVPVQPAGEGVGRLCRSAISASPIWKMKDGICVGPSPPCIFVQIWHEAELCGLAKLVLSELKGQNLENINLQGYEQLEEDVDVLAVSTNRSIGKLRAVLYVGLEPILEALQEPQPLKLVGNKDATYAAALMTLCCLSVDGLQSLESELKQRKHKLCAQKFAESDAQSAKLSRPKEDPPVEFTETGILQSFQPSLSPEQADALALWLREAETEGPHVWSTKPSFFWARIQAVHESFDQLIKEVGDECASVALDFLDVAAPLDLQRPDVARVLKFRGIELGWNTLERIFLALGCSDSSDVLPASNFAQLFRSRAERRMVDTAQLRQLEAKVLAWWRWRDESPEDKHHRRNVERAKCAASDLVSAYSKSDGASMDLMGLKVLLASIKGPDLAQDEVQNLAQWLFEGFGARPGGGVSKNLVVRWLNGNTMEEGLKDEVVKDVKELKKPQEKEETAEVDQAQVQTEVDQAKVQTVQTVLPPVFPGHGYCESKQALLVGPLGGISEPQSVHKKVSDGVQEQLSQATATIQLSKPLRHRDSERLCKEILSNALQLPPHQIKVFGAEEGSSRICIAVQGEPGEPPSTCDVAIRNLALQLKDPSSPLLVELQEAATLGCAALEVRDNGGGIDPEDFDHLGVRGAASGPGRGESLAALVALSQRVVLLSKAAVVAGKETWCKSFQRGAIVKCGPAGSPRGDMANLLRVLFFAVVAYGAVVEEEMNALLDDSCEGECSLSLLQTLSVEREHCDLLCSMVFKGSEVEEAVCNKWAECPKGAKYYRGQQCNAEGKICESYGSQKRTCLKWVNCRNGCYCANWAKLLEEDSEVQEKA
eukprot:Skav201546  [mRNA]  locus=scaffold1616:206400:213322:+ [translate_table: standard]